MLPPFTVVVSDGVKETAGEVQVSVRAVDDAPVLANPIVYAATAGKPLVVSVEAILAAFNDIDGGAFAFNSIVGVSGGQAALDLSGQWLTVAPIAAGGQDVIVIRISGGFPVEARRSTVVRRQRRWRQPTPKSPKVHRSPGMPM